MDDRFTNPPRLIHVRSTARTAADFVCQGASPLTRVDTINRGRRHCRAVGLSASAAPRSTVDTRAKPDGGCCCRLQLPAAAVSSSPLLSSPLLGVCGGLVASSSEIHPCQWKIWSCFRSMPLTVARHCRLFRSLDLLPVLLSSTVMPVLIDDYRSG